jgi:ketosteroid isomerase-like protein
MKLATILMLIVVAHSTGAAAQDHQPKSARTAATTNAVGEIKRLEEMHNQAVLHGDVDVLDRMTSDDYTFITLRGEMRTKQGILKGFASRSFHYESRQIFDLKVRVIRKLGSCNRAFGSEGDGERQGLQWRLLVYQSLCEPE